MMASTTSMILCSAESVPMVMSVPQKSLSMEPTMPTMWSSELLRDASSLIRPGTCAMEASEDCAYSSSESASVCRPSLRGKITFLEELIQQAAPLLSEQIGTSQAAVSPNHAQVGDVALHQVVCRFQTSFMGTELFTAGAADDGAALKQGTERQNNKKLQNSPVRGKKTDWHFPMHQNTQPIVFYVQTHTSSSQYFNYLNLFIQE